MPSMTITIERTSLTLRVDGREVQVESSVSGCLLAASQQI